MRRISLVILTHLNAFVLGGYTIQQYKFHQPVEGYRWVITTFFFCFFLFLTTKDKK